jgi:integrase
MSVTQRGTGWQAGITFQGRRIRRQFLSQAEAHQWLHEAEAKIVLGIDPSAGGRTGGGTLGDALDATISDIWSRAKSADQLEANGREVTLILGRDRLLDTIDKAAIRAVVSHYEKKGLSSSTINRKLAALSKILKHAVECDLLHQAPRIKKLPERLGRIRWLTIEEEDEFVAQLSHHGRPRMGHLVQFLADTGCRVGEAIRLRWEDIHQSDGMMVATIWESKNGASRSIPLTQRIVAMISEMDRAKAGDGPFTRVNQDSFNREWQIVRQRLGKDDDQQLVPHALRHTCASRLVQRGVEILTVKELLGHKSLAMTMRYSHLAPKTLRSAVQVLDTIREP